MRFYNIERSHCFVGKTLVEIKDVDKTYNVTGFGGKIIGKIKALKNLNLKIEKGEIFNKQNLTTKRPGNGLSPFLIKKFIGKKSSKKYKKDQQIK